MASAVRTELEVGPGQGVQERDLSPFRALISTKSWQALLGGSRRPRRDVAEIQVHPASTAPSP